MKRRTAPGPKDPLRRSPAHSLRRSPAHCLRRSPAHCLCRRPRAPSQLLLSLQPELGHLRHTPNKILFITILATPLSLSVHFFFFLSPPF